MTYRRIGTIFVGILWASACLDTLAPLDGVGAPCVTQVDCGDLSLVCKEGYCLKSTAATGCNLDGQIQTGELCDDGNNIDIDACSNACEVATCGDGKLRSDWVEGQEGFESCDDGNTVETDGCTNRCAIARCGDAIERRDLTQSDPKYEACDDGNQVQTDACLNDCTASACGDGLVQAGVEACDDGNEVDGDGCSATCTRELLVESISAGMSHNCGQLDDGSVKCWGYNGYGQLGDNSTIHRLTPVEVLMGH
jgi:cysteine-rich repeat protein